MDRPAENENPAASRWSHPVDVSTLALFRIGFGFILCWEAFRYFALFRIDEYYKEVTFHFTYPLFGFVKALPGEWMFLPFLVMGTSALLVGLGLFYRLSAIVFFLSYTYIFLIDSTQYNNHYYFISLVGFLLCFISPHVRYSIDAKRKPAIRSNTVPFWQLFILRFQIVVVYFYGGVAKINPDWLQGEPLRHWLYPDQVLIIEGVLTHEMWVYFLSYAGMLFDLLIGFTLLWRKTRMISIIAVLIFNLGNSHLFSIGIFPWLMIATTVLFLQPETPRLWLRRHRFIRNLKKENPIPAPARPLPVYVFLGIYCGLQILLPFRHWLWTGNVSWTEEGHRFAWHMKLRSKRGSLYFIARDPATGSEKMLHISADLTDRQIQKMTGRPDMILQYAHYARDRLKKRGIANPEIYAKTNISLNFKPRRPLIDPNANLAERQYSLWSHNKWILTYED